jgi:16S rRNA (uracil1498-N3)-methyltransferase
VRREPDVAPRVGVALALTKSLDVSVARATELGIAFVEPVATAHSVVHWDGDRVARGLERLRTVVREAAAQSRRARLPDVRPPTTVPQLAGRPGLVIADRTGSPVAALGAEPPEGWTVLVGPEGGFAPGELDALSGAPRVAVGPFVLKAETAPVAVVAALMSQIRPGSV